MNFATLEAIFSKNRLTRYLTACGGNDDKAVCLYKYNIEASQALYPLISILEVSLRNAIDRELTKHFKDANWLITQRNQFANHIDMVYYDNKGIMLPDHFFTDKIKKAEEKLNYRKVNITHGKLLAELTFGFWVKFFDTNAVKVLKGVQLQAFGNKPSIKLAKLHSHLNNILNLRNRIYHNEPICFNILGKLCLDTIGGYETNIIAAIGWINYELREWTESMNLFKPVFEKIKTELVIEIII